MKTVLVVRHESTDQGTFGRLITEGLKLFTGELPWRDNQNDLSCIPAGHYQCQWTFSNRFKRFLYLIEKVEKRAGVRVHSANFMGDKALGFHCQLNGCIALGEKLGVMEKQKAVLLSKPAIRRFESLMGTQPFLLEVKSV